MSFSEELKKRTASAEDIVLKYIPENAGYADKVREAAEYSVSAGGKRLRPVLMREAFIMYGGEGEYIEPFMAALEFIHNYSLVHDDLPAMDNDMYRRGKKTTHAVYGDGIAVLAGDCLLNLSVETALKAFDLAGSGSDEGEQEEIRLRIIRALKILFDKAGLNGMIGGQSADVDSEKNHLPIDNEKLLFIHENKTAALIEAALMTGAALAGAGEADIRLMEETGSDIGIAFQIKDDILDVIGDEKTLGKHVGSDAENDKVTYVTIHGIEKAEADQKELSMRALDKLGRSGRENLFLRELISSLVNRDK
ncbi:MAG: polyprenyl synthetase family protein [Lachnospiraceae bacterium]|nr:polyprenyl synthetase family protein [Lachnospiraceae bacterium]